LRRPQAVRLTGWLAELVIADDSERAARLLDAGVGQLRRLGDRWAIARWLELDQAAAKGSLSRSRQGWALEDIGAQMEPKTT
jgi:hypothetical protein